MQIPFETKPIIKDWEHVIILFYKYVFIESPEEYKLFQIDLCNRLGLKGRVIIANEGINATLEGTPNAINEYVKEFTSDPRFHDVHMKYSEGIGEAFPKLRVRTRPEIVALKLGEDDLNPADFTAPHIKPSELHAWFENKEDFVIVDMRNDYEHAVGHFKDSVLPPLKNFRDLPKVLPELEHLKDKKILAVCTGGIRCEKASAYLLKKGFEKVHQLDGGMVSYMEQYPAQNFKGAMYTFDNRHVMDYDGGNHEKIGKCRGCGATTERHSDCKNESCQGQYLLCDDCFTTHGKIYCKDRCNLHLTVTQ